MGISSTRLLSTLALVLALPLAAQDEAYKGQYQINYKRFTRGDDPKVIDEAWGRLEWFRERMGGELGPDFAQHLLREAEKERTKYPSLFRAAGGPEMPVAVNGTAWVSLGPTTAAFAQNGSSYLTKVDSGRLRAILPDTADATGNTVYVLASGGGLWKTTTFLSAAPTWTPLTDFIGSNLSGSAAFGSVTSTLYVGAGDPFDLGIGGFMVKSTNGGTTWSASTQLGTASKIYDLKVDTSGTDIVLVGTNTGLYRSADAGGTYAAVATIPSTAKVWSLARTSSGWLAATTITTTSGTTTTTSGNLYLSTNQGASWTLVSPGITGAGRITLGVGLPGDSVVYAYAANTNNAVQLDLFRSPDGGSTWTALAITTKTPANSNADNTTMDLMDTQPWYNHMILVDPADAARNTVYLGGQLASARTTNGGTTWTLTSNWLAQYSLPYIHADFHCAAYSNLGGTPRLYFGTDGGLFTSTDGGTTWDDTKNKGLVNHLVFTLAANPGVAGSALVGLQDNGTRIRSGLTSTFNQVRGGDGFGVAWSQANNAVSMSSYLYNSIKRSTTNPVTDQSNWSSFTTGLGLTGSSTTSTPGDDGASYYFVTPIVTPPASSDPGGQAFFTYGNGGTGTNSKKIFQSGTTGWTVIGTTGVGGITSGRYVRAVSHGIGVSPTDLQHIAAAGNGGYLLLTANGGTSWSEVYLGSVPPDGQNIGWTGFNANIAWANNTLLYVCSESSTVGAAHVAKSSNGGTTWLRADTGLPDVPVTKLAVDPGDATGNTVYAATWLGVYRTTNGGTSWSVFGTGLPQGRATDIWVAPDSSTVRVATWGRGVWGLQTTANTNPTAAISPTVVTMVNGGTQAFTPTITNGTANTVTWASAAGGTVPASATATGVAQTYTAPASGTTDTVTVTTIDTPAASASSAITLVAPSAVTVAVSPATSELMTGNGTQQFSATASPLTNNAVAWSGTGMNASSGLFSAAGLAAGPYTVTATSQAAPSRSGTATVTLLAPSAITVSLAPTAATLFVGGTKTFTATVTGPSLTANKSVTWSVNGGGSITSGGVFTATTAGSFTVTATNTFSGIAGTATITINPAKSLDLNGDGVIDLRDLLFFSKYFGTTNTTCDLNGDGTVNDADLGLLLAGL